MDFIKILGYCVSKGFEIKMEGCYHTKDWFILNLENEFYHQLELRVPFRHPEAVSIHLGNSSGAVKLDCVETQEQLEAAMTFFLEKVVS